MPQWMHERAEHILAKNPDMPKSEAFAIATQQSHALGKSPKGYGTAKGKHVAKAKFKTPKDDVKAANPGKLESPKMEKKALLDRLVRLGATDIPNTPRMLMKHRSPEELAALQHGVAGAFGKLEAPVKKGLDKALSVLPEGRVQKTLRAGGHLLIENPEVLPMQAVPIPGLTPAYMGLKKGVEKAIDHFAPAHKTVLAFAESQYSGGTAAKFIKQESDMPPFRMPSLQASRAKTAQLPGGLADKAHKKLSDFPKASLDKGEKVEHEHTPNHLIAREISMDHLTEDPKYYQKLEKMEKKEGAGAPTRGGFMMASDMPPFRMPPFSKEKYSGDAPPKEARRLKLEGDALIEVDEKGKSLGKGPVPLKEKDGDMMAGYMPYSPGDFKPVDIMKKKATQDIGLFVRLLKEAATPLGATSVGAAAASAKQVGAPRASAPPGPSIAQQSKPIGFGLKLPGAIKNGI